MASEREDTSDTGSSASDIMVPDTGTAPHRENDTAAEIAAYLKNQEDKDLLRFLTCGSVDDGKSTLIGRLLYDCQLLFEDQLAALNNDSGRYGTQGPDEPDLALLVDGLAAEREQGITIDVAYRFFTTDKRKFVVADTPGHEQYTRNMVTGASTTDLAVLLVDARKGVLTQTRRHSYLVSLLGIRQVVLAVNKMDLVDWDQSTFESIAAEYRTFAGQLGIEHVTCIPVSALKGDNVSRASTHMPWFDGPTLLEYLETVKVGQDVTGRPFRMPVQWVNRPNLDFRGFSGTIASGTVKPGDEIVVLPSAKTTTVKRVVTMDGDLDRAFAGQAVTLVLDEEIDISRGDVIASAENRPSVADQFSVHVVWMSEQALLPERSYLVHLGSSFVGGRITRIKHTVNVNTLEALAASHLELNDVAIGDLHLDRPVPFDPYAENPQMGSFILIDRMTNATVGAGMIDFALRRSTNVHWHATKVDKQVRAAAKGQTPCVLWFTGLSGAGKSVVSDLVEQRLNAMGKHTMLLDGDNVRHGLNRDLGFTDEDRVENIRRVSEVSRLMVDAGLIVLISFISPFRSERQMARDLLGEGEFFEIFVDTPLEVCEARDPKGLYKRARAGEIPNFTGIGSPYEPPENPELRLEAGEREAEQLAKDVVDMLAQRGVI
jgi:bifunctional enzyme CysN/CysC